MRYRRLGKTGLQVSEIGFGGEWLERHPEAEGIELIHHAAAQGINILDCWMADPTSRDIIGKGIRDNRSHWYIQGHIGSTWKDGQYFRSRDIQYVRPAFEDLLQRLQTDYIDLGMIHYVDSEQDWAQIQHSDYLDYIMGLKKAGVIRHIGISSHNPKVAKLAAESGYVEMILFSIAAGLCEYPDGCLEAMQQHFRCHVLKAGEIAEQLGNAKCMNIVLFGSMAKALGMDDIDWEAVIAETVPPKFRELNLRAYRAGHDAVQL